MHRYAQKKKEWKEMEHGSWEENAKRTMGEREKENDGGGIRLMGVHTHIHSRPRIYADKCVPPPSSVVHGKPRNLERKSWSPHPIPDCSASLSRDPQ